MQLPRAAGGRPRLALTALVDVVFILLFFFMLASQSLQWQRLDIELGVPDAPAAAQGSSSGARDAAPELAVLLFADGSLRWSGEPGTREMLREELRAASGRPVVLVPGPGVPLQALADVIDALQDSGARLRLGRLPEPAP